MFIEVENSKLTLPCKDCHDPVTDSETNAYRLIAGVLYGWCDRCFKNRHTQSEPSFQKEKFQEQLDFFG